MRSFYRFTRGALAAVALLGLLLFTAWHVLALRIAAVYRAEGGYVARGWGKYKWF